MHLKSQLIKVITTMLFTLLVTTASAAPMLTLVAAGKSSFKIVVAAKATQHELTAAKVLQQYVQKVSQVVLPIVNDTAPKATNEIWIGYTNRSSNKHSTAEGLVIQSDPTTLMLYGGGAKGTLYAVYAFIEQYLNCRLYSATFEIVPKSSNMSIPTGLHIQEQPSFTYREVYYPDSKNQTYLDWHKLNRLDDHWGLWGHTFDKLVPARTYFATHPEYYALVRGKRKPTQLCLSNASVFKLVTANLKARMKDEPTMKYWSVSQNDDVGYCECDLCKAVDQKEGGPQGSILNFVNKIAAQFPDQIISTLAYTYSQRAPLHLKPAKNVQIMLCSIDCNRSKPIEEDSGSASFRRDLKNWSALTPNLMIWDYTVQFTNYISPFPNLHVLQRNLAFFQKNGVSHIFSQGSGDTRGEFAELRAYLLAKLSWHTQADAKALTAQFLNDYYGKAAPFIHQYIDIMREHLISSNERLNIYGSPVPMHRSYLSPLMLTQYGELFDAAEKAVSSSPTLLAHVQAARLPVEYAVLQQARFFGIDQHGVFVKENKKWVPKANMKRKVAYFVKIAEQSEMNLIAEEGANLTKYLKEWEEIFAAGPKEHLAIGAKITAITPFSEEYHNKGIPTLVDGTRGYLDLSYNWLGWFGNDFEVVVDLGKEIEVNETSISFLQDQRHWAFLPAQVSFSFAKDGVNFGEEKLVNAPSPLTEDYEKHIQDYTVKLPTGIQARYVKVKAKNLKQLPPWREHLYLKPWLFADEVMVR